MAGYKRQVRPGVWRLEYQLDGEKYSKNVKAKNSTEANKLLALFVAEVEKGTYYKATSITFVEFSQLFIDKYATPNLSITTVKDYKSRLNTYILKDFGMMQLKNIKRLKIQEFANKLVAEYNLSSKTAKNYIILISSILNKAVEWDYIQTNVADKVTIPKNLNKMRKKNTLYSYNELKLFIKAFDKIEDRDFKLAIYTFLNTGARRGEVVALTFHDIDFKKNTVIINKSRIGNIIKRNKNG